MNVNRLAEKDAHEWAAAEMFFGKGAGTRRRLLSAEIASKKANVPGYASAFVRFYRAQDMGSHALRATKERKRLDRTESARKNVNALVRGDHRNLSAGLAIGATVLVWTHNQGYDKVALDKAKALKKKAHSRYRVEKAKRKLRKEQPGNTAMPDH